MKVERFLAAAVYQKALTIHCIIFNARSSLSHSNKSWKVICRKSLDDLKQSWFNQHGAFIWILVHKTASGYMLSRDFSPPGGAVVPKVSGKSIITMHFPNV